MKKIISLFLCLVSVGMFSIMGYATNEETTAVELEINVNNRYTNINEMDEYDEIYLDIEDEARNARESRKLTYITILCVLLVVAIVILIISLKRVPPKQEDEDTVLDEAKFVEISSKTSETSIEDEEKED